MRGGRREDSEADLMEPARQCLDKRLLRRSFNAAAASYDAAAVLQRETGKRLIERLELVRLNPRWILDIGAGTGATTRQLMQRYPRARFIALDIAPAMLRRARRRAPLLQRLRCACADAESLPFAAGSFDLVFSNLTLQWVNDPERVFREVQRVLRPNGLLLFTSLGPDTLKELRQSWECVDGYVHVNRFVDMHEVGDAVVRARLADPVMEMEYFTLTYRSARDLVHELKALGAHNVVVGRNTGLTGRRRWFAMEAAYERLRAAEGLLPATYEVIYGHAWGTPPARPRVDRSSAIRIPLTEIGRRRFRAR
ncbi:MAG: malonyl-ACP O-methyltransferase BioC [Nitrococcus mobilis]|nr:malonyl-ACP O-methyltransferase BioC [Nitrococcus mobilis]